MKNFSTLTAQEKKDLILAGKPIPTSIFYKSKKKFDISYLFSEIFEKVCKR